MSTDLSREELDKLYGITNVMHEPELTLEPKPNRKQRRYAAKLERIEQQKRKTKTWNSDQVLFVDEGRLNAIREHFNDIANGRD